MKTVDDLRWILFKCAASYDFPAFEDCTYPATCCDMHRIANDMIMKGEY